MATALRPTQFVTFPRSGHHLTVRLLARYFSRNLEILRTGYELPGLLVAPPFVWCEYYHHCRQVGCTDPRVTAQKSHDFDLDLVPPEGWSVVVQYRNPIPAIVSHYHLLLRNGDARDSYLSWRVRLRQDLRYYRRFVEKWICGPAGREALHLEYGQILADPVRQLCRLIGWLAPDRPVDQAFAARVAAVAWIRPHSNIRSFRYYDRDRFQRALEGLFPTGHPARRILPLRRWAAEI